MKNDFAIPALLSDESHSFCHIFEDFVDFSDKMSILSENSIIQQITNCTTIIQISILYDSQNFLAHYGMLAVNNLYVDRKVWKYLLVFGSTLSQRIQNFFGTTEKIKNFKLFENSKMEILTISL